MGLYAKVRAVAIALIAAIALAACASGGTQVKGEPLVVGSQDYYSNQILAEVYAQALEAQGFAVTRAGQSGTREEYVAKLAAEHIDVFAEYTGNLLQFLDPGTTATGKNAVYAALSEAMPGELRVLNQSLAADQDSYVVTAEFADQHSVRELGDLAGIAALRLGGNAELEGRPYGPLGLKDVYNVDVEFVAIDDAHGTKALSALREGRVELADVFSAAPELTSTDLVVLGDPKGLFLANHIVPVVTDRVDARASEVLNRVSAALGQGDLIAMNAKWVNDGTSAGDIAAEWLKEKGLI